MKIHEYQGKEIFRKFGRPTPRGIPAFSVEEAVDAAKKLGGSVWVVKAQIHAGGRGKGGGVQLARSIDDVRERRSRFWECSSSRTRPGPKARRCAGSSWNRAPTSGRSSTSAWWSTAAPRRSC